MSTPFPLRPSRLDDNWLLDELSDLRRQLADIRGSDVLGQVGPADDCMHEAIATIRGIEIEFYGTKVVAEESESANVVDLGAKNRASRKAVASPVSVPPSLARGRREAND